MNITIIGGGAMGSVYAALLARAGNPVTLIDRHPERVAAINAHGLRLEGPLGDQTTPLAAVLAGKLASDVVGAMAGDVTGAVTGAVAGEVTVSIAPPALIVLAVKAADVGSAARLALPLLDADTVVLALQNGLGSAEDVAAVLGGDRLAVGIASGFGASIKAPGHAHHNAMKAIRFGAWRTGSSLPLEAIAAVWRAAGFDAEAVTDIAAIQWRKLICNVAYSAPCALSGLTVGQVMDDPDLGPISRAAAREAWAVASACGIDHAVEDPEALVRAFGQSMPNARPSALQDIAAGRRSEIDVINGAVPRYGRDVGVPTPVNDTLVALIRQRERGFAGSR